MNIENALLQLFAKDVEIYRQKEHDKGYNSQEEENQWSYIVEIFMILVKTLRPNELENKIEIDYNRWNMELELWQYYRHGENEALLESILENNRKNYWIVSDDTLALRAVVLAYVNSIKGFMWKEVLKNTLRTTGNFNKILSTITFSMILNDYFYKFTLESAIDRAKEFIINISQVEYFKYYSRYSRQALEEYTGNKIVDFEKARIKLIMQLDSENPIDTIKRLEKNIDCSMYEFYKIIENIDEKECKLVDIKDKKVIISFIQYLNKLKEGRIDPRNIKSIELSKIDLFKFSEGETVEHPILGKTYINKKGENSKYIKLLAENKTGIYRFLKVK